MSRSRTKHGYGSWLSAVLLFSFFALTPCSVLADPQTPIQLTSSPPATTASQPEDPGTSRMQWIIKKRILIPPGMEFDDPVLRPLSYWRAWANQKLPFLRVLISFLLVLTAIQLIIPGTIAGAQTSYRERWLRSFGVGLLIFSLGPLIASVLSHLGLYMPLATVVLAAVQLFSLAGMTVAAITLGQTVRRILRLNKPSQRPRLDNLFSLWIGVWLLSLLVLLPGIGPFPGMGTRLLLLISAAGAGSVLRYLRSCKRDQASGLT